MKQTAHHRVPVTQVTQVTVPRESRTESFLGFISLALYRSTVSCVTSVTGSRFAAATPPAKVDERPITPTFNAPYAQGGAE